MPQNDVFGEIFTWGKVVLSIPVALYQGIRQAMWDWKTLAIHQPDSQSSGELAELKNLYGRLLRYEEQSLQLRKDICLRVIQRFFVLSPDQPPPPLVKPSLQLIGSLVSNEEYFSIPKINFDRKLTTADIWVLTSTLKKHLATFEKPEVEAQIEQTLVSLLGCFLSEERLDLPYDEGETPLFVPLHDMLSHPAMRVETVLALILNEPGSDSLFPHLWRQLDRNALIASGIDPDGDVDRQRPPITPTQARNQEAAGIIQDYLADTPLADFLQTPLPFSIPFSTRFAHTHILGGSGHGKTQLLQHLILDDLKKLTEGKGSIVVIDSQGDMIRIITHLAEFSPSHPYSLADRLVLIDPNDIEHPPCLNLFDFGLERLSTHSPVEREKLKNGAIALYEYLFGALLGAELTGRQGMIFTFLARLMMTIPGATIHTLMDLVENPEETR
jgi:hypothetical protein